MEKQRYILTKYVGEDALVKNIHAGLEEAKKDLSATKITYEKLVYAAITLTHLTGKCHDFSLDIPNCSTMHLSSLQKYCLFVYGLHEKGMEGLLPKNAVPLLETALVQNLEQLYSERETWTTVNYFINLNKLPEDRLRQVLQPYHLKSCGGVVRVAHERPQSTINCALQ
ncbi:hypothetical protein ADEAN_000487100 [Angomonas deanei]|uniref:Uncharacterized protein n=1 Tax=Angomonas deanei TaxID=59799 RepID=A0A7G2CFC0_9TRYP|nr:hypothetical protein ADEAN_000487100 [Angomonas deanei]